MIQLVTPNLNITYRGGWCEKAIENTVGQDGVYGSAYKAWLANVQHADVPPRGIYAPIYLNMPNGPKDPDGTQQDDVALICPDGTVAAVALSGVHNGLFKYPSLQAYINDYAKNNGGATYRGYGEYIGKVKVIGDEMLTAEQEQVLSLMATGSYPGKDYNYAMSYNKPATQENIDAMINFWNNIAQGPDGLKAKLSNQGEFIKVETYVKKGEIK